jgi:hypothetical protein
MRSIPARHLVTSVTNRLALELYPSLDTAHFDLSFFNPFHLSLCNNAFSTV